MFESLKNLFSGSAKRDESSMRLVIGLNQVDKIEPEGWDNRLNKPTEKAEEAIKRRIKDIVAKLKQSTGISEDNIEYYSALKRYRLLNLLNIVITNTYGGFKLDNVEPKDPFELADPEVKAFADEQRKKNSNKENQSSSDQLFSELKKFISEDDLKLITEQFAKERQTPAKIAILGKAGVGKTTTVNNLFNADWTTSPTTVGTTEAQTEEFNLPDGGVLSIIDLPGYARTIQEDEQYEKIYQEIIPSCDLILLILQADTKDLSDDQEMIIKIQEWLKKYPVPKR